MDNKWITIIVVLLILILLVSWRHDSRITELAQDLKKAAEQSKEKFTKLSDSTQRYTQLFQKLEATNEDESTDAKTLMRLKEQLADAMEDIPEGYWSQLAPINNLTDLQDELAQILKEEGQAMSQRQSAAELGERVDKGHGLGDKMKKLNPFDIAVKWGKEQLGFDGGGPRAYKKGISGAKAEKADQENILKTLSDEDLEKFAKMGESGGELVDEMSKLPTLTSEMIDAMKGMEDSVDDFEGFMERLKAAAADRVRKKTMGGVNEFKEREKKTILPTK